MDFCKWSNLWSKHFVGVFLKRVTAEKVNVYKGVFSMIARLFVALLFARSAFLPAGASPRRLHAPKRRALPTAPHPGALNYIRFLLLLQGENVIFYRRPPDFYLRRTVFFQWQQGELKKFFRSTLARPFSSGEKPIALTVTGSVVSSSK